MHLKKIDLVNWRSYGKASFDFGEGTNLIIGKNTAGKTNILEAVYFLAITKSFRTRKDLALVKSGEEFAKVSGVFEEDEAIKEEIRLIKSGEKKCSKEIRLDGLQVRALDVVGRLKAVIFSPEEMDKFFSFPARRRRWIDLVLSVADSQYAYAAAVYKKVVDNRNRILKKLADSRAKEQELIFWDSKWLDLAGIIIEKRRQLIKKITKSAANYYRELFCDGGDLRIEYKQTCEEDDLKLALENKLKYVHAKELRYGNTIAGPHREDVIIKIDGVDIGEWGSRAQNRLTLLSLKLAEKDFIEKESGVKPIVLLDDIFSELDEDNKKSVLIYLKDQQTIITATEKIKSKNWQDCNIIELS